MNARTADLRALADAGWVVTGYRVRRGRGVLTLDMRGMVATIKGARLQSFPDMLQSLCERAAAEVKGRAKP